MSHRDALESLAAGRARLSGVFDRHAGGSRSLAMPLDEWIPAGESPLGRITPVASRAGSQVPTTSRKRKLRAARAPGLDVTAPADRDFAVGVPVRVGLGDPERAHFTGGRARMLLRPDPLPRPWHAYFATSE